jgi:DUF971 family protein
MTATYDVSNLTLTKKTIHVVKVEPTIDGNVTEYNFVTDTTERLVAQADAGSTSAYSIDYKADEEADEASCYVLLTSKGAKLYDDDANKGVATLVIPFKATRGTYTINGEVTPTQNVGGKWNVVDFGTVAIMADSKKNVAFANRDDNGSIYSENVGAIAVGSKITYSVVFDLDNETATATITNGSTTETIEASCDSISDIKFVTNGSGYISKSDGRTDRELLIPSVTITKNSEPKTVITKADENNVAYVKVDGNKYAIAIIGSDNLDKDGFNLSYANEDDRLKDDLHEVYEKVTINGNDYTSASLTNGGITNAYLYGFKVSSSDAKAIIGETTVTYTAKTTTTE